MTDWNDVKVVTSDREQILAALWIMYPVLIAGLGFLAMLWVVLR